MVSRAELLRELRKMRFLEIYERCRAERLSYAEAAETLESPARQACEHR